MKTYFKFCERPTGGWIFSPVWELFCSDHTMIKGSFNLIGCRIAGLGWPQWLRFCRKNGAKLYGKNNQYVIAVWQEPNKDFEKLMNDRANKLASMINIKELHF